MRIKIRRADEYLCWQAGWPGKKEMTTTRKEHKPNESGKVFER